MVSANLGTSPSPIQTPPPHNSPLPPMTPPNSVMILGRPQPTSAQRRLAYMGLCLAGGATICLSHGLALPPLTKAAAILGLTGLSAKFRYDAGHSLPEAVAEASVVGSLGLMGTGLAAVGTRTAASIGEIVVAGEDCATAVELYENLENLATTKTPYPPRVTNRPCGAEWLNTPKKRFHFGPA